MEDTARSRVCALCSIHSTRALPSQKLDDMAPSHRHLLCALTALVPPKNFEHARQTGEQTGPSSLPRILGRPVLGALSEKPPNVKPDGMEGGHSKHGEVRQNLSQPSTVSTIHGRQAHAQYSTLNRISPHLGTPAQLCLTATEPATEGDKCSEAISSDSKH